MISDIVLIKISHISVAHSIIVNNNLFYLTIIQFILINASKFYIVLILYNVLSNIYCLHGI